MAHALTGIEAERESRQLDAVRTAAWICVIASLIFMAIEIAEHTATLFIAALRLGIVTIFLATAMATRRGWLRPSLVATLLTACAFLYCVLVIGRGTPEDDDLLPVVVAITPVVIPLRLRIAFPLLALAAVGFCVAVAWAHPVVWPPLELRAVLLGTGFGMLMAWLNDRNLRQTVLRRAALRAESSRLARDSERARLARDLHDHIGARLTAIALRAERDSHRLPESAMPTMRWVQNSAQLCLEELRDTIWALSAQPRNPGELIAVLRRRAEDVATEAGLELRWQATAPSWEGSLSAGVGVALSAILREALTNVVRHSEASTVDITVSRDASSLTLEIQDNGRGMADVHHEGRGLSNMRSRAEEQHGIAEIQNGTPAGVRVFARLPLDANSQHMLQGIES